MSFTAIDKQTAILMIDPNFGPGEGPFDRFVCALSVATLTIAHSTVDWRYTASLIMSYCGYSGRKPPACLSKDMTVPAGRAARKQIARGAGIRKRVEKLLATKGRK